MLKIWTNNKALFHIPKTAGSSTTDVLNKHYGKWNRAVTEPPGKHHPLQEIRDVHEINIQEFDIYTLIRNPYACVVSLYFWIRRGTNKPKVKANQIKLNPEVLPVYEMDFPEYIDWYCEKWLSYKDWLFVDGAVPNNITIWKTETMVKNLKGLLGTKIKVGHWYNMNNKHYSKHFNRELYDKINKKYEWCFEQGFYKAE